SASRGAARSRDRATRAIRSPSTITVERGAGSAPVQSSSLQSRNASALISLPPISDRWLEPALPSAATSAHRGARRHAEPACDLPLAREAEPLVERDRAMVVGLDLEMDAAQAELAPRPVEQEGARLGRQAAAAGGGLAEEKTPVLGAA